MFLLLLEESYFLPKITHSDKGAEITQTKLYTVMWVKLGNYEMCKTYVIPNIPL